MLPNHRNIEEMRMSVLERREQAGNVQEQETQHAEQKTGHVPPSELVQMGQTFLSVYSVNAAAYWKKN